MAAQVDAAGPTLGDDEVNGRLPTAFAQALRTHLRVGLNRTLERTEPLQVPAVVKSLAAVPGRFYVLTDYSLEVWSSQPAVPLPRRRGVR